MGMNIPKSDKEWQAEADARTLIEAEVIKTDSLRFNAAVKAAEKMLDEKEEEMKYLEKLANAGMNYKEGGDKR